MDLSESHFYRLTTKQQAFIFSMLAIGKRIVVFSTYYVLSLIFKLADFVHPPENKEINCGEKIFTLFWRKTNQFQLLSLINITVRIEKSSWIESIVEVDWIYKVSKQNEIKSSAEADALMQLLINFYLPLALLFHILSPLPTSLPLFQFSYLLNFPPRQAFASKNAANKFSDSIFGINKRASAMGWRDGSHKLIIVFDISF